MIRRFKDFDAQEFVTKKKALEEALDNEDKTLEIPEDDPDAPKEEDVITGKAIYDNPYLFKIARIIWKRLKNIGEFGIFHDIIYLNNVPGIWFYGINDNQKHIVCCRNTNIKTISVFKEFQLGGTNTAIVTYSTEKFGFKDMIDQLIEDLKEPEAQVNEELIVEAGGFGDGYSDKNIANFKRFPWVDKEYMYDLLSKGKKGDAILQLKAGLDTGDRDIIRILSSFAPTGKATTGSAKYIVGLVQDIMSDRYSAMNKDFKDLVDEYQTKYKGGGPAISTSYGEEFEVRDLDAEEEERIKAIEAAREAEIKEDMENYEETLTGLRDMTTAMCHYVKQNGEIDRDDRSVLSRRAVLLTGAGGIGKTYTVTEVLKEQGMVENKDYKWISLGATSSAALYTTLYEYNGKLIVFDDAPLLFQGEYRESLWKNALQTDIEQCKISFPQKEGLNVYKADTESMRKDRQKRYFLEIGRKSDDERMLFFNKEMKRLNLKEVTSGGASITGIPGIKRVSSKDGLGDAEVQALMYEINDRWKEEAENAKPAMPNTFTFKGLVMIITNVSRDRFIGEVGKSSWEAISSRFKNFDISPKVESLWGVMKKKILTEYNDKSIPDDLCAIPRDMTEEFIAEVESLIADPNYQKLNWRTIRAFGDILRGAPGLRTWKRELKRELAI